MSDHATGWNTGLCQDYCRQLSLWFASRIDARHVVRRWFGDRIKKYTKSPCDSAAVRTTTALRCSRPAAVTPSGALAVQRSTHCFRKADMTPETQLLREALQDIEQAHDLSLDLEHYDARQVLVGLADKIKRALSAPAQPADTAELLFAAFGDGPDDEQCKDLWFRYHSLRDWHKRTFAAQPASGEAVEAGVIEEIDTDDDGQQHAWVALANPLPLATKLYTTPPASQEQWETSPKDGEQWQTVPKASQEQAQPSGQIAGRVLGKGQAIVYDTDLPDGTELYTAPQSAQVPMTREQVIELLHRCHKEAKESAEFVLPEAFAFAVVSAIEAHHGIGGNEATDRTTP